MSELPTGWIEAPIGMVCEVVGGSTPRTTVDDYWDGDIPWLTPADLSRDRSQYVAAGRRCLTKTGYSSCSTQLIPAGSVLYTSRAPIGYVAIAKQAVCTNQGFKSFVPPPGLSSRYLYWYLQWATPMIRNLGSGTTFAEISGKVAKTIPLRLPPTAEQERIVVAIEEQVSRLDTAEQLLGRVRRRSAQMRAAVLAQAVEADWPVKPLGELLVSVRNGIFVSRPAPGPPGVPILRISAVRPLQLDLSDIRYAPISLSGADSYLLKGGDLLFTRYSGNPAYAGACAVVPAHVTTVIHPDKLIRGVVDRSLVMPEFVAIAVNVGEGRRQIDERLKTTAGQVGIAGGQLKTVEIPIPPLKEQERVVAKVDHSLTILDALATATDHSLFRSDHLRHSILERAFSGQLVSQDPGDEPASDLLARIAGEYTAQQRRKRA